jgi:hypothetical protein
MSTNASAGARDVAGRRRVGNGATSTASGDRERRVTRSMPPAAGSHLAPAVLAVPSSCRSGGRAAGFELDRADLRLGTPAHALVLAASGGHHPESFILVHEEQLGLFTTWPDVPAAQLIRADMVYFATPNGGVVFSVGSITFCGSLARNHYDNNIARLVNNVLSRFRTT